MTPVRSRAGHRLPALLVAARPRHWIKNLLLFAAPLFALEADPFAWWQAVIAFAAFCAISSATYLLNDVLDIADDRAHPAKARRPIASAQVPVPLALATALALAAASLGLAAATGTALVAVVLAYGLIQVGYCLRWKRTPLLDLFCIASGFLLRAVGGVVACGLGFSPWFLLTVGLLALFLAVEKRKSELRLCIDRGVLTRPVLGRYSLPLLQRLENLVATSSFMSYALWSAGPALNGAPTPWMLITVPLVLLGIFRYQLLSDPEAAGLLPRAASRFDAQRPEEALVSDPVIRYTLIVWLFSVGGVGVGHRLGLLPG